MQELTEFSVSGSASGLRSETSPNHARVSFYLYLRPMNNKDRMTP